MNWNFPPSKMNYNYVLHKHLLSYLNFKLQLGINGVHHFCSLHGASALITFPHKLNTHVHKMSLWSINLSNITKITAVSPVSLLLSHLADNMQSFLAGIVMGWVFSCLLAYGLQKKYIKNYFWSIAACVHCYTLRMKPKLLFIKLVHCSSSYSNIWSLTQCSQMFSHACLIFPSLCFTCMGNERWRENPV